MGFVDGLDVRVALQVGGEVVKLQVDDALLLLLARLLLIGNRFSSQNSKDTKPFFTKNILFFISEELIHEQRLTIHTFWESTQHSTLLLPAAPEHGGVSLRVEDEHVHVVGGQLLSSFMI